MFSAPAALNNEYSIKNSLTGNPQFVVSESGNVGITTGGIAPTSKLHIANPTSMAVNLDSGGDCEVIVDRASTGSDSIITHKTAGATNWIAGEDSAPVTYNASYSIKQTLGSTPHFVIHTNGNIGMGTSNIPSNSLVVERSSGTAGIEARQLGIGAVADFNSSSSNGFAAVTITRGSTNYWGFLRFRDFPNTFNWYVGTGANPVAFNEDFVIKTVFSGNPEFIIDKSTGNVGINTGATAPTSKLHVEGGAILSGNPTGGDTGAGTINVQGDIFKNNTAYTNPDYVLEKWATGKIEKFKDNPGASNYDGITPIENLDEHMKKTFRLPGMDDNPKGVFDRSDFVLEKLEEAFIYISSLHQRIRSLEDK
jgi:hypothetical protein